MSGQQWHFAKPELCHAVQENTEELLEVGFQGVLPSAVVILWKSLLARRQHLCPCRFQGKPKNLHCSSQRPRAVLLCLTEQKQAKLYLTIHC